MVGQPVARTLEEKTVKSVIGDGLFDFTDVCGGKAKREEVKEEINQIALSKGFHQRIVICLACAHFMMHLDHQTHFFRPLLPFS